MIPYDQLLAFLGAAVLITLAPGPDILAVLTRGMTQGRRVALAAAAGFASGVFVHTVLAVVGLSAVVASSPAAYRAIKLAGAAYLAYVGLRLWRAGAGGGEFVASSTASDSAGGAAGAFRQSVAANVLNPKVAVFFLSFLPQFVDPERGAPPRQFALLGAIFALQAWACFSVVALGAGWIGDRLRHDPRVARWLLRIAGVALAAIGVSLAWS